MKKLKILYIILLILICFLPLVLMPFFQNSAEIEKRELTAFPEFIKDGKFNVDFSTEFESWFNDRLPLRAYLLSASNFIKSEMLKAPSSNVIVGNDGWLFYETESADFMNTNALTEDQIKAVGVTLSLIEENIKEKGGNFTFVAMPNKASVYEEHFPSSYKKSDENNLTRINRMLDEMNVNHVDMLKVMRDNKEKGIYHVRDSHWNYQGALIGYNAIMDSLNKEHKTYSDATYKIEKNWRADLDKLLYPVGGFMDDQYIYDIDYSSFRFEGGRGASQDPKTQLENFMSDKEQGDDDIRSMNTSVKDGKKLFMARDSFARAILPFFIDNYSRANFKRTDNPDIVSIGENTDMVYEIVERNLHRVIATAPYLFAPQRQQNVANINDVGNVLESKYSNEGYAIRVYGALNDEVDMANGRIYVELSGEDDKIVYEAFPIFESKLLDSEGTKGYSMFINPKDGLKGEYRVRVIIGNSSYNAQPITFGEKQEEQPEFQSNEVASQMVNKSEFSNYNVIYNNKEFAIGDNIKDIKEDLGEESKPSEVVKACNPYAKGENTFYYYDGLAIETNYQGIICSVSLENDNPSLKSGAKIGQRADEVTSIMANGVEDEYSLNYKVGDDFYCTMGKDDDGIITSIRLEDMSIEV